MPEKWVQASPLDSTGREQAAGLVLSGSASDSAEAMEYWMSSLLLFAP